eukprot:113284_1
MASSKDQPDKPNPNQQTNNQDSKDENTIRWCYYDKERKDNEWVDYDKETTEHIEQQFQITIASNNRKKEKMCVTVKLKKGAFFGLEENQNKYKIVLYFNGLNDPPCIERAVQSEMLRNSKLMINVTRFPSYDFHRSQKDIYEIENYTCKNKWYHQIITDTNDEWKQYDPITSKIIEIACNKEKSYVVLNKGEFNIPKCKNLYVIKFNHHSIPPEATEIQYISLKKDGSKESEVKFEEIENKDIEMDNSYSGSDEIMEMIIAIKHYMRPLSMRFWTQKRSLSPNDPLACTICFGEFDEESFLEYWIHRKIQGKAAEENEIISSKGIAIQLCKCAGEHFFHAECVSRYVAPKRKCPLCSMNYGVEIGQQPYGIMQVRIDKKSDCASKGTENKGKGTITIIHKFKAGIQGKRHQNPGMRYPSRTEYIYLPRSAQGMECLGMIRMAWKRKLLYTVGRSVTLSLDNRIIWTSIHFKTAKHGGSTEHGWPDKTYFARVKDEFKFVGITEDDIENRYKRRRR